MGNFDKVVVLLVLFLVAIVLGVSLNGPDDNGDDILAAGGEGSVLEGGALEGSALEGGAAAHASGPLESLRDRGRGAAPGGAGAEAARGAQPDPGDLPAPGGREAEDEPLLHVGLQDNGGSRGATVAETALPRILLSEAGLAPTQSDEYRVYTWGGGDTWSSVATRYYGASSYASYLRSQNEGRDPQAGERILVPVVDFTRAAGTREPARVAGRGWAPRSNRKNSSNRENSAEGGNGSRVEHPTPIAGGPEEEETPFPPAAGEPSIYVVQEGQTLSHVSLAVYGSAVHWKRIYEANTDVLPDENTVATGQRLRIPALGGEVAPTTTGEGTPGKGRVD